MNTTTDNSKNAAEIPEVKLEWWKTGVVYQIYPRSFKDSNGDGVGDLKGIRSSLYYLQDLGIKAIWISPFYPSPMADFGYDISNYTGIDPLFGTMEDFDLLLQDIHQREMKLILDLVPNHTSDEHPWFLDSRSSREHPKRDWYIWEDPAEDGGPPNNWLSVFGGSAWELDEETGQYYYHAFHKKQPDLNWRNSEVQQAMFDVMEFWLKKGVDGFRVDVMWHMIKDQQLRDNPINPQFQPGDFPYHKHLPVFSTDQPEVHQIVRKMRQVIDKYDQRLLIGEIYLPIHKLVTYYGEEGSGAHLPFNFQLLQVPWDAHQIEALIDEYEAALPRDAWPNWVLGNHDKSRIASRVGEKQAKVAMMLLLTLRGTPTLYYGDEIGMEDVSIPQEKAHDPQEVNFSEKGHGRDPERTPMQWDDSRFAGFSTVEPWLPVMKNLKGVNVQAQRDDTGSFLSLTRRLIQIRNREKALYAGEYAPIPSEKDLLSYMRTSGEKQFLIVLNLGSKKKTFAPQLNWSGKVRVSNLQEWEGKDLSGSVTVPPDTGLLIELQQDQTLNT